MTYVGWAVLGMVAYSLVTLLVKLATQTGQLPGLAVLTIATMIVGLIIVTLGLTVWRGALQSAASHGVTQSVGFACAAGVALAVSSLFIALSLGPATVVVPVYGMFIAGGAILGMTVLGEPVTLRKLVGLAFAILSIVLIAGGTPRR